ncbi:ADP-dependent NAD(P)H-hydrate dehydratase [Parafrigoribacterium soli]|uniref:ADP-dependent NAD(P)H-hydrate dehydratase n=1 Tax=Parafrigoribacterium soli TaxID=3144663 RepID=UPI0032EB512B
MTAYREWTASDAASCISVPRADDDKYSRGVIGIVTGSDSYPGAAVLGVEAALRTGVGMVRYLGPQRPTELVLQRRPEAVASDGRVQAWLLGSGMDAAARDAASMRRLTDALDQGLPTVIDAGALDLLDRAKGPVVITPHLRELARVLGTEPGDLGDDPAAAARRAADRLGVTVLLKGHRTHVAAPDGTSLVTSVAPAWTATAGTGDALGGVLGALLATHASEVGADESLLARLAATASVLHGLAAARASAGGPFVVLDLARELPAVIAALLSARPAPA